MTIQTLLPAHSRDGIRRADRNQRTHDLLDAAVDATEPERRRLVDEAVLLNLGLAESIARRYTRRGIDRDDLVQVARLGLVNAARRFDPGMGRDFVSYAVPTMTGEVKRYFRDHGWTVRPPRRVQELHAALSAATGEVAQQYGHEPSDAELAEHLGVDCDEVSEARGSHEFFTVDSIDYRGGDGEDNPLADAIGDEDSEFERAEAAVAVGPACRCLGKRDRRILYLRFFRGWTQQEIAGELGVSQMQVSRLLSRILKQLRRQIDSPERHDDDEHEDEPREASALPA